MLRRELSESVYNKFIEPLYLKAISSKLAVFCCPESIVDELDDKYEQIVKYACEEVLDSMDYIVVFGSDDDEYEDIDDGQDEDNSIYSEEEKEIIFEK